MLSIHNIKSIAVYETKTLMRSWFFRIFAILSILVIAGFNFTYLIQINGGAGLWEMKGLPSIIPYVSLLLLNVVQAVIAIFLASDFLKRDKKLDTTDVIYVRPMTNAEYVVGKTLGNLLVFLELNLIVLAVALLFNLLTPNVSVNWISYLYYFVLISIPTLVFIMGFSFFLMSVIKNQAVTFVVLLGYVAISLFYLEDKYYYLFDYMAYNIPITLSDFVGFGDLGKILVHRGMYFFLGVGFIHYTFILLKRLSQSKAVTYGALIVANVFLILGFYLGYVHVSTYNENQNLRENMVALNDQYAENDLITVTDYDIKLEHLGESISCDVTVDVINKNSSTMKDVIFSLNPGLELSAVKVNGNDFPFERKLGVIKLKDMNLGAWQSAKVTFTYSGGINEAACYLDIDDETLISAYSGSLGLYQMDKRYAFITDDYVLLTRETNWYPIPGAGIGVDNSQWFVKQFSNYKLDVTTSPDLVAVSQGAVSGSDGHYTFESSHTQAQISVSIAEYEKIQGDVDGLEFNVYTLEGHDYFSSFFEEIQDTIPAILAEALTDYERELDLYYPFERFSLVEVPIQFYSYERVLSGAREQLQPEMILLAEKGLLLDDADFYGQMQRRSTAFGGMPGGGPGGFGGGGSGEMTPREIKIQVLNNFLSSFTEAENRSGFMPGAGVSFMSESTNTYYAFPLFYNYAYYLRSDKWPVTDRVFESFKKNTDDFGGGGFFRMMGGGTGVSEDEEANLALLEKSFEELLKDPDYLGIISDVIQLKSDALFSIIQTQAGETEFADFIYTYLWNHRFGESTIEEFAQEVNNRFGIDLIPYMDGWFNTTELPAFLIGDVTAVTVLDDEQEKTMVKFKVSNTEDADGIIKVTFRAGGGGMGGGRFGGMGGESEDIEYLVYFEGNQTKDLSFLVNGTPRGGSINTLTSRNIPSEINIMFDGEIEENSRAVPFEGETIVDKPVSIAGGNEVIVDNEDPGFHVAEIEETSLLRELIFKEDTTGSKYKSFNQFRAPSSWTLTTNSDFFGANIRSAYYTAGSNGEQKAQWTAKTLGEGSYDVYVYVYVNRMRGRNRWGGGNSGRQEYHYLVHTQDGVKEVVIDLDEAEEGWNHIGTYYFSSDTAVIEMTNESNSSVVVADAIKLIKN